MNAQGNEIRQWIKKGDHVFRAPALILAPDDKLLTLVPALEARRKSDYRW